MRALLLVMLVAGCDTAIPDNPVDCDTSAVASTNVRVVDENGEPIADAVAYFSLGDTEGIPCESTGVSTFVCGWEQPGPIDIWADAWGYEPQSVGVDIERDECHVITQQVTLTLPEVACTDEVKFAVLVQPISEDGQAIERARVEAMPFGENWTSPEICQPMGEASWGCGEGWTGETEIWVSSREFGSWYDVVDVPFDECGPITQVISPIVDRNPG